MSATAIVLGVLGLCRVIVRGSTHVSATDLAALRWSVVGVLGLSSRTRRRATFLGIHQERNKSYAKTKKLNKPNTLNSNSFNALNLLSFICVGFVLGSWIVCRVAVYGGIQ